MPEIVMSVEHRRELEAWRAKVPQLDELADLLGVCEGMCPIRPAIIEIRRLRTALNEQHDRSPNRTQQSGAKHSGAQRSRAGQSKDFTDV